MNKWISVLILLIMVFFRPCQALAKKTENMFQRYKNRVIQVRIIDRTSNAKAIIGSGFIVSRQGHIISNYHVVSQLVHYPDRYRAQYLLETNNPDELNIDSQKPSPAHTDSGKTVSAKEGELILIDIDVVHDLAILKAENLAGEWLEMGGETPARGERLFAMGNPLDLGLTIVEGTFNGFLEKSLYEKIHFTGSINPGMSGGPVLNKEGKVIGINVATAGNQVSFLVPARYAIALISKQAKDKQDQEKLTQSISKQLLANQDDYMRRLLNEPFKSVSIGSFKVPGELASFIKCWGDTSKNEKVLYEKVYYSCSTEDDIYLSKGHSSGAIRFRHELFRTEKLNSIRFYNFLEKHFKRGHLALYADEKSVSNYKCSTDFVDHNSLTSKVVFCMRKYKIFKGLYDAFFAATTLVKKDEALFTTFFLSGVSYENALHFSRKYMEGVAWKD